MSSSLRRSRMEALKQGNVSSEDDDEEFYDDDNDNEDLDDFVINDEDVGYKASAHQKPSQSRQPSNQHKNRRKPTMSKTAKQSQSCSISRRKRQNNSNKNNKAAKASSAAQPKNQSTMKSFFKPSTAKPRNVVQKSKRSKKKKAPKQNDDAFMDDILGNMDSDEDEDVDQNTNIDNDCNEEAQHDTDMNVVTENEAIADDVPPTQAQTQMDVSSTQLTEAQQHHTQTQHDIQEPPKKRFKLNPTANNNNNNNNKAQESDKMEMDNDNIEEEETDSKEIEIREIPAEHNMFNIKNNNNKATAAVVEEEGNTDHYPVCDSGFVDIFWFDAYEDAFRKPGEIYLFGKTLNKKSNEWQSVCLFIKNIERCMYVLPRLKNKADDIENGERIEFINVYNEVNEKRQKLGINKFAAGPIEKKYCFRERAEGIPASATYLKLCYSFKEAAFVGCGKTYSHVFGSRCSALELFMLDKQLMGPCWLRVPYGKPSRIVSWCKKEIQVDDMEVVTVLSTNYPSPPLKVLSLSFQTVLNKRKEHEVACISAVVHDTVYVDHNKASTKEAKESAMEYFTFVRKIDRNPFPYDLEKELKKKNFNVTNNTFREFASERELLTFFLARIHKLDPDVIVGHKLYDFLLDVILHRMDTLKINLWSKIGRLRKAKIPFLRGRLMKKYLGAGRLLCDTFLSAQEFIHEKTYTLSHLVNVQLGVENHENFNPNELSKKWIDGKELASVITHCCNDSNLVFNLMQKLEILALTKELTNLCGNLWSRSLTSQRAERNEYLLLHEFHRNGYIVPERYTKQEKIEKGILRNNNNGKKRGKAQYSGGLVLEPTRGLYDKYVLCLDFNSLYPSIIQEYNLCFTSCPHWKYITNHNILNAKDDDNKMKDITTMQASIAAETGILPKAIGLLLTRRGSVKKLLKSAKLETDKKRFDIQQKALKLVANSMYGCLGFEHSRFYCKPIAALITALGRESLMKAAEIASSIANLKVIYGDTDSIFIYTDCDNLIEARNYAKEIKKRVNKTYHKMYLELDYVFSKMLLLRKKKYAAIKVISFENKGGKAVNIVTKKEIKGLDLVRRDWSIISKDVGKEVLDAILAPNQQIDDVVVCVHELLTKYRKLMDANEIELNRYVITKKLTKQPKDYPDPRKQPHVMVAIEIQKLGMNIGVGSFIEYIICKTNRDGSSLQSTKAIAQRAYHIKEIRDANGKLEVDRNWYLEQQILPPVGRYCDPIQGTDVCHLAHALGLDSNKFNHLNSSNNSNNNNNDDEDDDDIDDKILRITNPLQKYAQICKPLKIKCRYCGSTYDFGGVYNFQSIDAKCGLICATTNCKGIINMKEEDYEIDVAQIKNSLSLQIWQFIVEYYEREWQCVNLECAHKTRQIPLNGNKCPKIGCAAKMKETYSASKLFDQLRYFAFLFDKNENEKMLKAECKNNPKILENHQKITQQQERFFNDIHQWCKETILQRSKYYFIDSKLIFKFCM